MDKNNNKNNKNNNIYNLAYTSENEAGLSPNIQTLNKSEDKYIESTDNLDYIINRSVFNKYLKRYLDKCNKYGIKLYYYNNSKYNLIIKDAIMEQINIKKYEQIKIHIDELTKMLKDTEICNSNINNNKSINSKKYMEINNKLLLKINKKLVNLDTLFKLTEYIYNNNLLHMEKINQIQIDHKTEYDNLINLSHIHVNLNNNCTPGAKIQTCDELGQIRNQRTKEWGSSSILTSILSDNKKPLSLIDEYILYK